MCCTVPGIDQTDVQKQSNRPCRHCGSGCGVYDTRPGVCREFFCAWRYFAAWDDAWRPDRSGVFARIETSPESGELALNIMLIDRPVEIAEAPWFVERMAALAAAEVPVYLGLPGPPGCLPIRVRLTREALILALQRNAIPALLKNAITFMQAQPVKPHVLSHSGNDLTGP